MEFESSDFRIIEPDLTLFKLAAKAKCKELEDSIEDSKEGISQISTLDLTNSIVKLSVTYQVLTP